MVSSLVLVGDRPFEREEGSVSDAPYVDVSVGPLTGLSSCSEHESERFRARIDTGADTSCVPASKVELLMPVLAGRPVDVRGFDGVVHRSATYLLVVTVYGWPDADSVKSYRPKRGVLLTDSDIGLIGMDIIGDDWDVTFTDRRFTVVSVGRGDGIEGPEG